MLFRYRVKKGEEYTFYEYVTHYNIIIQMFNSKKDKWKNFDTVDLGNLLGFSGVHWDNGYLLFCVEALEQSGGLDVALKEHIKKLLKEKNELNENEIKLQEAINRLDKMFASNKTWTVIELEEE